MEAVGIRGCRVAPWLEPCQAATSFIGGNVKGGGERKCWAAAVVVPEIMLGQVVTAPWFIIWGWTSPGPSCVCGPVPGDDDVRLQTFWYSVSCYLFGSHHSYVIGPRVPPRMEPCTSAHSNPLEHSTISPPQPLTRMPLCGPLYHCDTISHWVLVLFDWLLSRHAVACAFIRQCLHAPRISIPCNSTRTS